MTFLKSTKRTPFPPMDKCASIVWGLSDFPWRKQRETARWEYGNMVYSLGKWSSYSTTCAICVLNDDGCKEREGRRSYRDMLKMIVEFRLFIKWKRLRICFPRIWFWSIKSYINFDNSQAAVTPEDLKLNVNDAFMSGNPAHNVVLRT